MWEWLEGHFRPRRLIARLRRRNAYYEHVVKDLRATLDQANEETKELRDFINKAICEEAEKGVLGEYVALLQSRVAALNYEVFKLRKDNQVLEIKLAGALAEIKKR
jgi:hypothetical protein